ncbi:MAG: hypothetical protein OXU81_10920 [Gammaproteobacteria bacterium]|nr:hypothetical protein [Gammaproteobacteria bacterium]
MRFPLTPRKTPGKQASCPLWCSAGFSRTSRALAAAEPDAPLSEVRDAALVLLYRLLFMLYAEDRDLSPVRDSRFDDYALQEKVRVEIGRRKDQGDVFSDRRNGCPRHSRCARHARYVSRSS